MGTKNNRGNNQRTYALYEELRHLRVSPYAEVPYIYKRLDRQQDLPVEERAYQVRVSVPMEKTDDHAQRYIFKRRLEEVLGDRRELATWTNLMLKEGGYA